MHKNIETSNEVESTHKNFWIRCIYQWDKEARLLLRVVAISLKGHDIALPKLSQYYQILKDLIETEIHKLRSDADMLLNKMNQSVEKDNDRSEKLAVFTQRMTKLNDQFCRLKVKVLEQLEKVYPVTIF